MPEIKWTDVGRALAPLAPTLGGIIGGFIPFPGAGLAGQALGSVVAKHFGVEATPAAVKGAIEGSTNEVALAKLRAATEEMKAQYANSAEIARAHAEVDRAYLELIGKTVDQVNETMRARIGHEHWFFSGWRPMAGWLFNLYSLLFGALLVLATAQALDGSPEGLNIIADAWPIWGVFLGGLSLMVGVYTYGRSREKLEAAKPKQ